MLCSKKIAIGFRSVKTRRSMIFLMYTLLWPIGYMPRATMVAMKKVKLRSMCPAVPKASPVQRLTYEAKFKV